MWRIPVMLIVLAACLLVAPSHASAAPRAKKCENGEALKDTLTVTNQTNQVLYVAHLHYNKQGSLGLYEPVDRPECWYTSGWYVLPNGGTATLRTHTDKQNGTYIYATTGRQQWPRSFAQSTASAWVDFSWTEFQTGSSNISLATDVDTAVSQQYMKRPFMRVPYTTTQCTFRMQSTTLTSSC